MYIKKQTFRLKHLFCLIIALFIFENCMAQTKYYVLEVNDSIIYNGRPIKKGDVYVKGQKINWSSAIQQIKVYRNGYQYVVNYKGIKKIGVYKRPKVTKAEYLIKRDGFNEDISSTSHYSSQTYSLFGKKDILYLEREHQANDTKIIVYIDFDGNTIISEIESAFDGTVYAIPAKLFHKYKNSKIIRILKITEIKENFSYNDYTHGLTILYNP